MRAIRAGLLGAVLSAPSLAVPLTVAWDASPAWPPGTTVEVCANSVCAAGITATSAVLDAPILPGERLRVQARAIPPLGYQCGSPPVLCPPSEYATLAAIYPAPLMLYWARKSLSEVPTMADPSFAALGTLSYTGSTQVNSISTTITNVSPGDLLIVIVQRDHQNDCNSVSSSSPALTFNKIANAVSQMGNDFNSELWAAIATTSASSQVITANYTSSHPWGGIFSARYTAGVSSITPTATAAHTLLQSSTTNRTTANITTGVRTLLIAAGTNWDYFYNTTPATDWTERVDSDTFGNDTTTMFLFDRIANAGTYPNGNFATNDTADSYIALIAAFPVYTSGASGSLPPRLSNRFAHLLGR